MTCLNGRYVAIYKNRIVDEDARISDLTNRFFKSHPNWTKDDGVFFIWTCDGEPAGVA